MAQAILDIPTGGSVVIESKNITENGTYTAPTGVDGYSPVTVAVQPNLQSKTATENGTVTPDSGYDGLSSVLVNVSGGGGGSSTILHGDTAPISSQGQNGDIYLKTYSSSLPSGFIQVEYIAGTGSQWINTGYLVKANSRLVADAEVNSNSSLQTLFGARSGDSRKSAVIFINGTVFGIQWGSYGTNTGSTSKYKNVRCIYELSSSGMTVVAKMDHQNSDTYQVQSTGGTEVPLVLFALNDSGGVGYGVQAKLYGFSIYEDSTLVHNYIPCRNALNEAGVYDIITETFLKNGGNGFFSMGSDVPGGTHQYVSDAFLKRSGEWEPLIGADISGIL